MQSDPVSRVLLGFIAICMLLLLAQGAGLLGGGSATPIAAGSAPKGRFNVIVQATRGGALLVKTDTMTGQVWRKSLTGDGPWVFVDEESRSGS